LSDGIKVFVQSIGALRQFMENGSVTPHHVEAFLMLPALLNDKPSIVKQRLRELLQKDPLDIVYISNNSFRPPPRTYRAHSNNNNSVNRNAKIVERMVKDGQCGKALKLLEGDAHALELSEEDINQLRELHPQARQPLDTILDNPEEDPRNPFVAITPDLVKSVLNKCPPSANGVSPWTFDLLRFLCNQSQPFLNSLTAIFNLLKRGKGGDSSAWTKSRLIAVRKPNGKIRPIAIGEVILRTLGKCIMLQTKDIQQEVFENLQLGVGTRAGIDTIHSAMYMLNKRMANVVDYDQGILTIDFKNAFNTIGRGAISSAILQYAPSLHPLFKWLYCNESSLVMNHAPFCTSCSGVRQGCVLGPLFFSIGIQPILKALSTEFPTIHIFGFLDDITLTGPKNTLMDAYRFIRGKGIEIGLEINPTKSHLFARTPPLDLEGINFSRDGIMILGSPIGNDNFVATHLDQQLEDILRPINRIKDFTTDIAYTLLRTCIISRPFFVFKAIFPSLSDIQSQEFDNQIINCMERIVNDGNEMPMESRRVSSLPIRFGGLGLRSIHDTKSTAWCISFLRSYSRLHSLSFFSDDDLETLNEIQRYVNETISDFAFPSFDSLRDESIPNLRDSQNIFYARQREDLLRHLFESGRSDLASWQYSNGSTLDRRGANEWMFSIFTKDPRYRLSSQEFKEVLKLRLLLKSVDDTRRCPCRGTIENDSIINPLTDPYHPLLCSSSQGTMNTRHANLHDPFKELVRSIHPNTHFISNPQLPNQRPNAQHRRSSDLEFSINGSSLFVDFCVATPSAMSYMQPSFQDMSVDRACSRRIQGKINHYKNAMGVNANVNLDTKFKFFCLDATGRLGDNARELVKLVCGTDNANHDRDQSIRAARKRFYLKISVVCAKAIATAIIAWKNRQAMIVRPPIRPIDPPLEDIDPRNWNLALVR
jgi:hypothetical protein